MLVDCFGGFVSQVATVTSKETSSARWGYCEAFISLNNSRQKEACPMILNFLCQQSYSMTCMTSIQSAGVAPEVNLRITEARKYASDPPWLWNPEQMSPEVQNRGISGPTKGLLSSKNFKKKLQYDMYFGPVVFSCIDVEVADNNTSWPFKVVIGLSRDKVKSGSRNI